MSFRCSAVFFLILGLFLTAGCSPTSSRVGVGFAPGFLYSDYTTPLTLKRDRGRPAPVVIPDNLEVSKANFYQFSVPFVSFGVPGLSPLSVGVGNASVEKLLELSDQEEITFGDARTITILRFFERVTIITYGPPRQSTETQSDMEFE